jgi:paraquat-inducible protein A
MTPPNDNLQPTDQTGTLPPLQGATPQRTYRRLISFVLISAAAITLVIGLLAPSYTVNPTFGDPVIDALVLNYRPDLLAPRPYSIISTISALFDSRDYGLASIILAFSVVFPSVKMILLFLLNMSNHLDSSSSAWRTTARAAQWFLSTFGHWSMLDIFVVAVILVGFKSLPMGAVVVRQWGLFCFAASVLFGMFASSLTKPHILGE